MPVPGAGVLAFFESGARAAAGHISPAMSGLLLSQLILALWLVTAKVKLPHRQIGKFITRLIKTCPGLPTRSELDLWIRVLLRALEKYGFLPSADLKDFRRDASPLHRVTRAQLMKVAGDYKTLRALQKEFCPPKEKSADQILMELLLALRRRIEAAPDAVSPAVRAEFHAVHELVGSRRKRT